MDNLFEDSDDSEGTESKTVPDIHELLGDDEHEDEAEEEENNDGGYSPVIPAPEVDWDLLQETRPNRLVLDIPSAGPEPRTIVSLRCGIELSYGGERY
jgi:hypothetical protein